MKKSEKERKVWIKATGAYWRAHTFAALIFSLPWVAVAAGLGMAVWFLVSWALGMTVAPQDVVPIKLLVLVVCGGYALVVFHCLSRIKFNFDEWYRTFRMTESQAKALMDAHNAWCRECNAAEKEGRPFPPRPY